MIASCCAVSASLWLVDGRCTPPVRRLSGICVALRCAGQRLGARRCSAAVTSTRPAVCSGVLSVVSRCCSVQGRPLGCHLRLLGWSIVSVPPLLPLLQPHTQLTHSPYHSPCIDWRACYYISCGVLGQLHEAELGKRWRTVQLLVPVTFDTTRNKPQRARRHWAQWSADC